MGGGEQHEIKSPAGVAQRELGADCSHRRLLLVATEFVGFRQEPEYRDRDRCPVEQTMIQCGHAAPDVEHEHDGHQRLTGAQVISSQADPAFSYRSGCRRIPIPGHVDQESIGLILRPDRKEIERLGAPRHPACKGQPTAVAQHIEGGGFARVRSTREGNLGQALDWQLVHLRDGRCEAGAHQQGHGRHGSETEAPIVQSAVRLATGDERRAEVAWVFRTLCLEHRMIRLNFLKVVVALSLGSMAAASAVAAPAAPAKADPAAGQKVAEQVCAACHGADGNSTSPANPKLAGQHADYLAKQLSNFRVQAPATVAERQNAVMAGFAATLSDADMRNLASWFESQKLKPAVARDKALSDAGLQIYRRGIPEKNVPACAGCHAPNGGGIPAQYPRLQGQWADYTEAQLVGMRQGGVRRNSAQMTTIATRLTDREIKAVAEYVAGLR